jgi:hypothetical protein
MQAFMEMVFGNRFFELPFLEALSYIAAILLIGAIVVALTQRVFGMASRPSEPIPQYRSGKQTPYSEEDTWEWRKAA